MGRIQEHGRRVRKPTYLDSATHHSPSEIGSRDAGPSCISLAIVSEPDVINVIERRRRNESKPNLNWLGRSPG